MKPMIPLKSVQNGSDGTRQRAYQIECRECPAVGTVKVSNRCAALPQEVVRKKLTARGWRLTAHTARCPDCANRPHLTLVKPEPKELVTMADTPAPEPIPPRTPDVAALRRINREISENWDFDKAAYVRPEITDQSIATKLKVPRAWVSEVRDKGYGGVGHGVDVLAIAAEIRKFREECDKRATEALALAGSFEMLGNEFGKLAEKLRLLT